MVRLIQELREGELNSLKTFYRNDFVRMGISEYTLALLK